MDGGPGEYDAEGNLCHADGTYFDPLGVYHNADGSAWQDSSATSVRAGRSRAFYLSRLAEQEAAAAAEAILAAERAAAEPERAAAEAERLLQVEAASFSWHPLFRPPTTLVYPGSFAEARVTALCENRWLLINLQNHKDFRSHALNRDVWQNAEVQAAVKLRFLFWQASMLSTDGQDFFHLYAPPHLPFVAVLDPRTSCLVDVLSLPALELGVALLQVVTMLARHTALLLEDPVGNPLLFTPPLVNPADTVLASSFPPVDTAAIPQPVSPHHASSLRPSDDTEKQKMARLKATQKKQRQRSRWTEEGKTVHRERGQARMRKRRALASKKEQDEERKKACIRGRVARGIPADNPYVRLFPVPVDAYCQYTRP